MTLLFLVLTSLREPAAGIRWQQPSYPLRCQAGTCLLIAECSRCFVPLQVESYFGNVNCIGERSCYDEGKRAAETLTFDYMREHGLEVWAFSVRSRLVAQHHANHAICLAFNCAALSSKSLLQQPLSCNGLTQLSCCHLYHPSSPQGQRKP